MLPPGKYDGMTIYMRNGKPVVRPSKNEKGNPSKSVTQKAQRMRWCNVQHLWSTFPEEWHPLFQSRPQGKTNYNMFLSANLHDTPVYFTKQEAENYSSVLVPLLISRGSLREIVISQDRNGINSNISVGDLVIAPETTVQDFSKAVISNNRNFCQGDIITFVAGRQQWMDDTAKPQVRFKCASLQLDLESEELLSAAVGQADGFTVRHGFLGSRMRKGAAAWVHERPQPSGDRLVSTQRLWCNNAEMIDRYTSKEALDRASKSYASSKSDPFTPDPTTADLAGRI